MQVYLRAKNAHLSAFFDLYTYNKVLLEGGDDYEQANYLHVV